MKLVLIISLVLFFYVWLAYPLILSLLSKVYSFQSHRKKWNVSSVSVIIAAHNEQGNIKIRIENILQCQIAGLDMEVIVASDGSDDETCNIVANLGKKDNRIKVLDIQPQGGRANAHNKAFKVAVGDVLVFTDAETEFDRMFLQKIVSSFCDDSVGFASGVLYYKNTNATDVSKSMDLYWRFEILLRSLESKIGLYAFGTGACCAVRRDMYKEIPPTGDVDFTTPLHVVLGGKRCLHVEDAIAYDVMPETPQREFRARVRMTSKNFMGTINQWGFTGLLKHPLYSVVIFSHKIGRWFTPFYMIGIFFTSAWLSQEGWQYLGLFIVQVVFYFWGLMGWLRWRIPLAGKVYSFCLANLAFLLGILKAFAGRIPSIYKPVSQG